MPTTEMSYGLSVIDDLDLQVRMEAARIKLERHAIALELGQPESPFAQAVSAFERWKATARREAERRRAVKTAMPFNAHLHEWLIAAGWSALKCSDDSWVYKDPDPVDGGCWWRQEKAARILAGRISEANR